MISTLRTLISGANARAEETVRDRYSIELIEQKIREAEASLKAAKFSLASLIQRERSEERQIETLNTQIADLSARTVEAMDGGRTDLATEAAQAIADMENEVRVRQDTVCRLNTKVLRLRQSVETANRRIIDLRQGAVSARAVRKEQAIQSRLNRDLGGDSPMDEAADLIAHVLKQDDPFEQSEILREIDTGLSHETVADRMAAQGFGPSGKATASDVLARLSAEK